MQTGTPQKSFLTDTVLVAVLPAFAYLLSFFYEYGYGFYFNIPKHLISPGLTSVLIYFAAIGALLLSSIKFLGLVLPLLKSSFDEKVGVYARILFFNGIMLGIFILILNIYGWSLKLLFWLLGGLVFINIYQWGLQFILAGWRKSVTDRVSEAVSYKDPFDLAAFIVERTGFLGTSVIVLLPVSVLLSFLVGHGEAMQQKKFWSIASRPNTVLLRTYGDMMICATFNNESKSISGDLIILYMSKLDNLTLVSQEIGPLTVKRIESKPQSPEPVNPQQSPQEIISNTPDVQPVDNSTKTDEERSKEPAR